MAYDKAVDSAVLDSTLTAIADAIREKGGTSDPIAFSAMAAAIAAIEAGSNNEIDLFGKFVASGSITPAENIIDEYILDTNFKAEDGATHEYGAIIWRDEPYETDDLTKLYSSVIFTMYSDLGHVSNSYKTVRFTYGFGQNGATVAAENSYGRIANVDYRNDKTVKIEMKSLSYGANYAHCLLAGTKYSWAIFQLI